MCAYALDFQNRPGCMLIGACALIRTNLVSILFLKVCSTELIVKLDYYRGRKLLSLKSLELQNFRNFILSVEMHVFSSFLIEADSL